ncbi:hypothetical protein UY3_13447 [Chelonia mydas]|uniref:Uncharacterized protein n=1 Tax=Chelonia mydas TaxID=8469 RepID=M7AVE2_CHEMY|nr:hypothetical protein UY3_13447 [Chelonia mydas]
MKDQETDHRYGAGSSADATQPSAFDFTGAIMRSRSTENRDPSRYQSSFDAPHPVFKDRADQTTENPCSCSVVTRAELTHEQVEALSLVCGRRCSENQCRGCSSIQGVETNPRQRIPEFWDFTDFGQPTMHLTEEKVEIMDIIQKAIDEIRSCK